MNPKVSIVIPIYKVPEKFLRECIESCINQTLKEIEIILVDDGSPDNCGKICDEYAVKDQRIKVIHKENGGLVSARNAGYIVISGEWHMYLDGDDWIDNDTCEKLINYIHDNPDVNIIFWNHILELGEKSIYGKLEWKCEDQTRMYNEDACKNLAKNTLIYKSGIATAYCKLISTDYARHYNIRHDDRLKQGLEGVEFSLRTFYNARSALFVKEYFNHYRYNSDSISKRIDEKNTKYVLDCLTIINEDVDKFEEQEVFKKNLYQRTVYILIAMAMSTYFHPNNNDSLVKSTKKFSKLISDNEIIRIAVKKTPLNVFDLLRRIAFLIIKTHTYPFLKILSTTKQFMLKRGKYNY